MCKQILVKVEEKVKLAYCFSSLSLEGRMVKCYSHTYGLQPALALFPWISVWKISA